MRDMGFASWDLDKLTWEGRVEGYGTILVCVCAQEVAVERGGFLAGKLVPHREPITVVKSTDKQVVTLVVQIVLWYLDSGCSKNMTGDRSQLINFVQKFLGMIKFRNNHVAKIMGYGDYQIGNVIISRVYYVEGLGHNLFL
nr:integrase, catalytic region, zinc finger, CCHC-type, peptidase aspartic, catalytic [Tanacetum cinerariifolium]